MKIKNASLWQDYSLSQAWIGTTLILLSVFSLRYILHAFIAPYAVFHFFIVGCLLIQYLFGYKFSIPSTLMAIALAEYYFVPPYGTFDGLERKDIVIAFNFLLVTAVAIAFMEKLRRVAYSQELLLKVMESRHKISLLRENDRLFYAKKSNEVWIILEELINDFDKTLFYQYGDKYRIGPIFYRMASSFKLSDPVQNWIYSVNENDLSLLREKLDDELDDKSFKIRLIEESGHELEVLVMVDHLKFMGKRLSVVKWVDEDL